MKKKIFILAVPIIATTFLGKVAHADFGTTFAAAVAASLGAKVFESCRTTWERGYPETTCK